MGSANGLMIDGYPAPARVEYADAHPWVQARAKLPERMLAELKAEGHPLIETRITSSIKVRESHDASIPLIHYAPNHKVTQQLVSLYDRLD